MKRLITAKEAKEISNSYTGQYNPMCDIKHASSLGYTNCQIRFDGSDEELNKYIEKLKEIGYKIISIADWSIDEKYLTIEW